MQKTSNMALVLTPSPIYSSPRSSPLSPIQNDRTALLQTPHTWIISKAATSTKVTVSSRQDLENTLHKPVKKKEEIFIWRKKNEKDGLQHLNPKQLAKHHRQRVKANQIEAEAVRRRREQREKQREENRTAREDSLLKGEAEYAKKWAQQEEEFFLGQVVLRSELRLKEGRGQPIDYLAHCVEAFEEVEHRNNMKDLNANEKCGKFDSGCEFQSHRRINVKSEIEHINPITRIAALNRQELSDLQEDIKVYRRVHNGRHTCLNFWRMILIVVEHGLKGSEDHSKKDGIHNCVKADVEKIFQGKCLNELLELKQSIQEKTKQPGIYISYWENMLDDMEYYIAKIQLQTCYSAYLRKQLKSNDVAQSVMNTISIQNEHSVKNVVHEEIIDTDENGRKIVYHHQISFLPSDTCIPNIKLVQEDKDADNLTKHRQEVLRKYRGVSAEVKSKETADIISEDVKDFSDEVKSQDPCSLFPSEGCTQLKKARYINKVHTGFVWNRYNRTHYDRDNPPPKTVMGYKFTLFFPELLFPSSVPGVTLTSCSDEPGLAVLKISGGPPYEDVAFKVVDKEWDRSWKSGYRCQMVGGGRFELWFRFKRAFYRR